MESYGFNSELSQGNMANKKILEMNKQKTENVLSTRRNKIQSTTTKLGQLDTTGNETKTVGETILGQVASKGKDIQALGKSIGNSQKAFGEIVDAGDKYGVGALNNLSEAVSGMIHSVVATKDSPPFVSGAQSLFKSDADILKTKGADGASAWFREQNSVRAGTSVADDVSSYLKAGVSVGEDIGSKAKSIGKLGIGSTGLSVGIGLLDTYNDLESSKIEGNNTAERISNIASIGSGALEGVGTALDLTGVGAPVGVALNLLGGLAGLAGGASELVGEDEEKKSATQNLSSLQGSQLPKPQLQSLQDIQSSGAVVKSN